MSLNNLLRSGASSLAAAFIAILAFAPAPAAAKTKLTTSVSVTESFDDNVLNDDSSEKNSLVTRIQPKLTLKSDSDISDGLLEFGSTARLYHSYSELNAVDTWGRYGYARNLSNRLRISSNARYDNYPERDQIFDDGAPLEGGRPDLERFNGQVALRYQYTQLLSYTLTGGGSTAHYDLNRNLGTQSTLRDSISRYGQLQAERILSRLDRVRASVGYSKSDLEDEGTGELDTTILSISTGWNRRWTDNWRTDLSLGVRRLENEFRGGDDDSTALTGGFTLSRTLQKGSASLSYSRDSQGTSGGGSSVDVDAFTAQWNHKLTSRMSMTARASYQHSKSAGDSLIVNPLAAGGVFPVACVDAGANPVPCTVLTDSEIDRKTSRASLRFDYRLQRKLVTHFEVRWNDLSSSGDRQAGDYDKFLTTLGVRYYFDTEL